MSPHVLSVTVANAAAPAGAAGSLDILSLILNATGVVLAVLFILILLSVFAWFIIGYKAIYFARAERESIKFLDMFWAAKRLDTLYQQSEALARSPLAQMFRAGYVELSKLTAARQEKEAAAAEGGAYRGGDIHEGDDI